jgi:2-octaprenyl-6-methoxyphenol hydroxylase
VKPNSATVTPLDAGDGERDNRAMTSPDRYDVIIAGAGMAGATFALAAAQGGLKVVLVDPQPFSAQLAPTFDGRSTAIAFSTFRMLDALGVGAALRPHACRMDRILVTDGRRPGAASRNASSAFLRFDSDEIADRSDGEPLGYLVENRRIRAGLAEAIAPPASRSRAPPRASVWRSVRPDAGDAGRRRGAGGPLVVGAEGRASTGAQGGRHRHRGLELRPERGRGHRVAGHPHHGVSPTNISCPAARSPFCR